MGNPASCVTIIVWVDTSVPEIVNEADLVAIVGFSDAVKVIVELFYPPMLLAVSHS